MNQINIDIVKNKDLTIIKVYENISSEEIIESLVSYYKSEFTSKLLWDFSKATLSSMTREQLENIISIAKSYAQIRNDGKTAIVAPDDINFGMSRMYATMSELEDHPIQHHIFRNMKEAINWLEN